MTRWNQQSVPPKQVVGFTCVFNSEIDQIDQLIRKFTVSRFPPTFGAMPRGDEMCTTLPCALKAGCYRFAPFSHRFAPFSYRFAPFRIVLNRFRTVSSAERCEKFAKTCENFAKIPRKFANRLLADILRDPRKLHLRSPQIVFPTIENILFDYHRRRLRWL